MYRLKSVNRFENTKGVPDIYSGEEVIQFNNRHPIFKTLMKLEFEDAIRSFSKKKRELSCIM